MPAPITHPELAALWMDAAQEELTLYEAEYLALTREGKGGASQSPNTGAKVSTNTVAPAEAASLAESARWEVIPHFQIDAAAEPNSAGSESR